MPDCEFCDLVYENDSLLNEHIEIEHPYHESYNNLMLIEAKTSNCPRCSYWKSTDSYSARCKNICEHHYFIGDFNHDF